MHMHRRGPRNQSPFSCHSRPVAQPTPVSTYPAVRMFARCGGLFIQHGFATIIAARSLGERCWVNQQVTIGFVRPEDRPVVGDGVAVYAGAKVLGAVSCSANLTARLTVKVTRRPGSGRA